MMIRFNILLLLLQSPVLTFGQAVKSFTANVLADKIILSFTISQGNSCNGIEILRSNNSSDYNSIGSISGICGSATGDITYSFTDEHPLINQDNYYKLDLNTLGLSEPIKVFFYEFGENPVLIFPNPVSDDTKIIFPPGIRILELNVFDLMGKLVIAQAAAGDNITPLNAGNLNQGTYILKIKSSEGELVRMIEVQ